MPPPKAIQKTENNKNTPESWYNYIYQVEFGKNPEKESQIHRDVPMFADNDIHICMTLQLTIVLCHFQLPSIDHGTVKIVNV